MTTDKVQVGDSTVGTSTSTTYYTNPSYSAEKGWECPRCKRINAPWVRQCDCNGNNWTITSDWTYRPEWWKEVTCGPDTFKVHPETVTWKAPSSICHSDSATVAKSNPNSTVYTTAHNDIVGGSDSWNSATRNWENVPHTLTNMQKDLDEIKSAFTNTLRGE